MPKLSPAGTCLSARDARPADHPAVRGVLLAAYQEYASVMPPPVFERYLADLLDLDSRSRTGRLLVAEHEGRIVGTVTYYDDVAAEGSDGRPAGPACALWASTRRRAGSVSATRSCRHAWSGPARPARRCCACTPPTS
jgi:hypothetical protein